MQDNPYYFTTTKFGKKTTGLFDVTMGSYDGCEVCELVGLHILHTIKHTLPSLNFGLYRDDGLATTKQSKTEQENTTKQLHKIFKDLGLKITCKTNLTIVNALDVTLDLHNNRYHPYRKPNDTPTYIHTESNHPHHVSKQLPISINDRLNNISCDKKAFDDHKQPYEKALKDSGHKHHLTYKPQKQQKKTQRNRQKKAIWFTPPYCAALTTNIGAEFLKILDKNFPINNPLHKILNRRTVKISYSCTENMQTIMKNHNRKLLDNKQQTDTKPCNCQRSRTCPTPKTSCRTKNVIYNATITHDNKTAEYIGCTTTEFKERFRNHTKSFKHQKYSHETTLSTYAWAHNLNPTPNVTFKIEKKCTTYKPGQNNCDLCLSEKQYIVKNLKKPNTLNKRTDIGNKCIHIRHSTLQYGIT